MLSGQMQCNKKKASHKVQRQVSQTSSTALKALCLYPVLNNFDWSHFQRYNVRNSKFSAYIVFFPPNKKESMLNRNPSFTHRRSQCLRTFWPDINTVYILGYQNWRLIRITNSLKLNFLFNFNIFYFISFSILIIPSFGLVTWLIIVVSD